MRRWTAKPRARWPRATPAPESSIVSEDKGDTLENASLTEPNNPVNQHANRSSGHENYSTPYSLDHNSSGGLLETISRDRSLSHDSSGDSTSSLSSNVEDKSIKCLASAVAAVVIASRITGNGRAQISGSTSQRSSVASGPTGTSSSCDSSDSGNGSSEDHSLMTPVLSSLAMAILREITATDREIASCLSGTHSNSTRSRQQKIQATYVIAEVLSSRLEQLSLGGSPSTRSKANNPSSGLHEHSNGSGHQNVVQDDNYWERSVPKFGEFDQFLCPNGEPAPSNHRRSKTWADRQTKSVSPVRNNTYHSHSNSRSSHQNTNRFRLSIGNFSTFREKTSIDCAQQILHLSHSHSPFMVLELLRKWNIDEVHVGYLRATLFQVIQHHSDIETKRIQTAHSSNLDEISREAASVLLLLMSTDVLSRLFASKFAAFIKDKGKAAGNHWAAAEVLCNALNQTLRSPTFWKFQVRDLIVQHFGDVALNNAEKSNLDREIRDILWQSVDAFLTRGSVQMRAAMQAKWNSLCAKPSSLRHFSLSPNDIDSFDLRAFCLGLGKRQQSNLRVPEHTSARFTIRRKYDLEPRTASGKTHTQRRMTPRDGKSRTAPSRRDGTRSQRKGGKSGTHIPKPKVKHIDKGNTMSVISDRLFSLASKHEQASDNVGASTRPKGKKQVRHRRSERQNLSGEIPMEWRSKRDDDSIERDPVQLALEDLMATAESALLSDVSNSSKKQPTRHERNRTEFSGLTLGLTNTQRMSHSHLNSDSESSPRNEGFESSSRMERGVDTAESYRQHRRDLVHSVDDSEEAGRTQPVSTPMIECDATTHEPGTSPVFEHSPSQSSLVEVPVSAQDQAEVDLQIGMLDDSVDHWTTLDDDETDGDSEGLERVGDSETGLNMLVCNDGVVGERPSVVSVASSDAGSVVRVKVNDGDPGSELSNPDLSHALMSQLDDLVEERETDPLNQTQRLNADNMVLSPSKSEASSRPETAESNETHEEMNNDTENDRQRNSMSSEEDLFGTGDTRVSISRDDWKDKVLNRIHKTADGEASGECLSPPFNSTSSYSDDGFEDGNDEIERYSESNRERVSTLDSEEEEIGKQSSDMDESTTTRKSSTDIPPPLPPRRSEKSKKQISFAEFDRVHEIPMYDELDKDVLFYSEQEISLFWQEADEEADEVLEGCQSLHDIKSHSNVAIDLSTTDDSNRSEML